MNKTHQGSWQADGTPATDVAFAEFERQHILRDLTVHHTRTTPVLVIGQPRSGTTIFARMIRKYLKVNFGPESQFFLRFARTIHQHGDLGQEGHLRSLIADIAAERCFQRNQFRFTVDVEAALRDVPEPTLSAVIDTVFRQFARHNGMTRWGDKTPEYLWDLPTLYRLFPDAQFIHLVRDGRDVALSNAHVHFGPRNPVMSAVNWRKQMELAERFAAGLPREQYHELRYEDFLTDPVTHFAHLIDYLGISDPDGALIRFIADHIGDELKAGNFRKWKTRYSRRQQINYERVAGEHLRRHGYETIAESPRPMSGVELLFWQVDHFIRKGSDPDAWKDTFYCLKLRLRHARIAQP